jgi:hypothetical protein
MRQGKTITELATELERRAAGAKDFVGNTSKMTLRTDGDGTRIDGLSDESHNVLDHTHRQIGSNLKIPAKHYQRLRVDHPDLLDHTVNELWNREPSDRMVRTLDGNARAFLSDRYRPIDNIDIAEATLPILAEHSDMRVVSSEVTDKRMYLKAVFPSTELEVKKGDAVQAGVLVSNSEVGLGAVQVALLIFRLFCSNGMISETALRKHHVGGKHDQGDDGPMEWLRSETIEMSTKAMMMRLQDTLRGSLESDHFQTVVSNLRDATERKIEGSPEKAIKQLANRFVMTEKEEHGILRHLIEGGDISQYGVSNAVTRASQDVESYDRATTMERVGGKVIELPRKDWEVIAAA